MAPTSPVPTPRRAPPRARGTAFSRPGCPRADDGDQDGTLGRAGCRPTHPSRGSTRIGAKLPAFVGAVWSTLLKIPDLGRIRAVAGSGQGRTAGCPVVPSGRPRRAPGGALPRPVTLIAMPSGAPEGIISGVRGNLASRTVRRPAAMVNCWLDSTHWRVFGVDPSPASLSPGARRSAIPAAAEPRRVDPRTRPLAGAIRTRHIRITSPRASNRARSGPLEDERPFLVHVSHSPAMSFSEAFADVLPGGLRAV